MPCKPSPECLRQLCLNAVVQNLEYICYGMHRGSKELNSLIESDGFKEYPKIFDDWPQCLVEDLSLTVYRKRCGHKHLLHQVFLPQIRNLSIMLHGSIYVAMNLAATRCKNLQALEMTYSVNLPPMYYIDFFKHFPRLQKLNLTGALIDDNAFSTIGLHCSNLVELNASRTWITDLGLERLSFDPDSKQELCQSLQILSVTGTKVTPQGMSYFLQHHPEILVIDHPETFHAFKTLPHREMGSIFKLVQLFSTSLPLTPGDFGHALNVCPKVQSVLIKSPGIGNSELYQLMTLERLEKLHLGNSRQRTLNFHEGVAPVLVAVGRNLKKLVLEDFFEVDIELIGRTCPQLTFLALASVSTFVSITNIDRSYFRQLQNLEIWGTSHVRVCPNILKQCIINSPLTNLLLQSIDSVDDNLFEEIFRINSLILIRNLVFDQCQNITVRTLWKLLQLPNQLRILRCWNCKNVTEADKEQIKLAIQDSNLTLYWEWFPYCQPIQFELDDEDEEEDEDDY